MPLPVKAGIDRIDCSRGVWARDYSVGFGGVGRLNVAQAKIEDALLAQAADDTPDFEEAQLRCAWRNRARERIIEPVTRYGGVYEKQFAGPIVMNDNQEVVTVNDQIACRPLRQCGPSVDQDERVVVVCWISVPQLPPEQRWRGVC